MVGRLRPGCLRPCRLGRVALWAAATLAVDQLAKQAVVALIAPGQSVALVGSAVRLTHVRNIGAAFGLFPGQAGLFTAATAAMVALAAGLALRMRTDHRRTLAALGLTSGGAAGNLVDRLRTGAVVDFIDVGLWPVFNLADAAIVVGVGLLLWQLARPAPKMGPDEGRAPEP